MTAATIVKHLPYRGDYMPLRIKGLMIRHGLSQGDLAAAVAHAGEPVSRACMNVLINRGHWPRSFGRDEIATQVEAFLRAGGVPEAEIATAWEIAPADDHLTHARPRGHHRHAGAARRAALALVPPRGDEHIDLPETEMLSTAARRHFRLFKDPFQDDVSGPDDVFLAEDQRYIREAMFQTAKHGGFLAVIGESGAGKSVLRRDLVDRVAREALPIVITFPQTVDKTRLNAGGITEAIIKDLQPNAVVCSSPEARSRQLQRLLRDSSRAGNSHVLVIEEAHDLATSTLKYLKRFWEMEDGFRKLLAIVLIGQPELRGLLDERTNWEAREVIRRCEVAELRPLNGNLEGYLGHKLRRVEGGAAAVFADDAYDAMRARLTRSRPGSREVQSQLYPLVVNNLATKAMNRAAEIGAPLVTGDLVREL